MKKGILVIGSLNMDLSIDLAKMPVTGETILGRGIAYKAEERGPIRRAQLESWEGESGCWGVLDRMNSDKSW